MTAEPRIAVLTRLTPHAWIAINALAKRFGPLDVLNEERQGKWALIRARAKRQGILAVIGQTAFALAQKIATRRQSRRIAEIIRDNNLDCEPNPACRVYDIGSVNAMACRAALAMIRPDVAVVLGTRIIGRETLAALTVPIINSHAGWNPAYRGQSGGYWALVNGDREHAGVTVHLVDAGVDTGGILYQERFHPTEADSYPTYFYLQAGVSRPLLVKAVADALTGNLSVRESALISRQCYLPTLWGYLWTGLVRGVW
jgi:methionyl-tRNA formyltransferase